MVDRRRSKSLIRSRGRIADSASTDIPPSPDNRRTFDVRHIIRGVIAENLECLTPCQCLAGGTNTPFAPSCGETADGIVGRLEEAGYVIVLNSMSTPAALATQKLLNDIRGALGTDEIGENLVEVARDAHRAEMELAGRILKETQQ